MSKSILSSAVIAVALLAATEARSDTWVVTSGPDRGSILVTDGAGSMDVSWGLNHLFGANGYVTWDEQGNYRYKGELDGDEEFGPKGFGTAKKIDGEFLPIAQLIEALNSATNVILGGRWGADQAPNGKSALADLCTAIELIDTLKSMIDDKVKSAKKRAKLKARADKLKVAIQLAKAMLGAAEAGPGKAQQLIEANSSKMQSRVRKLFRELLPMLCPDN